MSKSRQPIPSSSLTAYRPVSWAQLPDLGLYMDQVILYLEQNCRPLAAGQGSFITPAMVNNYVKCGLLPRPLGKKYLRAHLAQLVMLCTIKPVATVEEMKRLFDPADHAGIEQRYAEFCAIQNEVLDMLLDRPANLPALTYAIEAAAFRVLCAEALNTREGDLARS